MVRVDEALAETLTDVEPRPWREVVQADEPAAFGSTVRLRWVAEGPDTMHL
jgi:hypothetical protein